MKRLISCSNCERYVREHESACPFCHAALPERVAPAARAPSAAGLSRAAAFAVRAALVAAAPGALACGGEAGTTQRDPRRDGVAAGAGGSGSTAQAGSGAQGGSTAQGGSGAIALDVSPNQGVADAGADAEPYAPVPIYGGVFPDPMSRARV